MKGTAGKGFRHDLVDDCGDSTMIQATKLSTKFPPTFHPSLFFLHSLRIFVFFMVNK